MSGRKKEPLEVNPTIQDLQRGLVKRPDLITITTSTFGGVGDAKVIRYKTLWRPHYSGKSDEEIHFEHGEFDTGRQVEIMMPWQVPQRHWVAINKVGGIIFARKRYELARLYGSRGFGYSESLYIATAKDRKGKEYRMLFYEEDDAELWTDLSGLFGDSKLKLVETVEVNPRKARDILYPTETPSWTIDKAKENGLRQKYLVYQLLEDVQRAEIAKEVLRRLEKKWVRHSWSTIAGDDSEPPRVLTLGVNDD